MEIYKREGGQTLWVGRNEEGKEVWGWSSDLFGEPCQPVRLVYESEKSAGYALEYDLKDTFYALPFTAKKPVPGRFDTWVFPVGSGWAYTSQAREWRPITKEQADYMISCPLASSASFTDSTGDAITAGTFA